MRRAAVPKTLLDKALAAGRLVLPSDAAHRFLRVLRLPVGHAVELFDGEGGAARGTLADGESVVDLVRVEDDAALPPLCIAQAVVKTDKLETVAKTGTELGLSELVLFAAARCNVHLDDDRADKRRDRLSRIATDAARQCGRSRVPTTVGPLSFAALRERVERDAAREGGPVVVVGALSAQATLSEALAERLTRLGSGGMLAIVGPEGGLSDDEVARLVAAGAVSVRLGVSVLRTETAGLAALCAAQAALGHL